MNIFGFTLLRNGIKYDYSFRECLDSLAPVTQKVYLALGEGEDETEKVVSELPYLKVIPTIWDDSLREGGIILSQQTNIALNALKEDHGHLDDSWGIYLQCDEVFHEEDHELILSDLKKAQEGGYDTVAFRYFHFWMDHHHIAINKKWYPQEIRAVKLNTPIESWGDAQSFRNHNKVYYSDAKIFHYGHVREQESYLQKKADILKLYHSDERIFKYKRREKRFDRQTETLLYWGSHPKYMRDRIERLGDIWELDTIPDLYIIGSPDDFPNGLVERIRAKNIHFVKSKREIPKGRSHQVFKVNDSWLPFVNKVPVQMRSKLALPWPDETRMMLKLSKSWIGLDSKTAAE
jgi:hypothetical protein